MTTWDNPSAMVPFLGCVESEDLSTRLGKKVLWRALWELGGRDAQVDFERYRDEFLTQELSVAEANRAAALAVAEKFQGEESSVEVPSPTRRGPSKNKSFDQLLARVRVCSSKTHYGIGAFVIWVDDHLGVLLKDIKPETVPGPGALSLWKWASENETEYRRLFTAKRVPAKGIAEDDKKGFIDDGAPIDDVMGRIREGTSESQRSESQKSGSQDLGSRKLKAS